MSNYSLPSAPLLLLVTDRTRYGDRALEDIFMPALAGGVNMLELRESDMTARDLLGEAERLRRLALGGVPLIVYDRVDVVVEPVFFSHYAQGRSPLGPTVIRRIKARVRVPILAGGGITAGNAHQVI